MFPKLIQVITVVSFRWRQYLFIYCFQSGGLQRHSESIFNIKIKQPISTNHIEFHYNSLNRLMVYLTITFLLFGVPAIIYAAQDKTKNSHDMLGEWHDFWVLKLIMNLVGYSSIVLPGCILIYYLKKTNYIERGNNKFLIHFVRSFIYGQEQSIEESTRAQEQLKKTSFGRKAFWIIICATGLQLSYLSWGLLQERIMAYKYGETVDFKGENFKNSQFLVFMNRIFAFVTACLVCIVRKQPRHLAPIYKYSYASFSNIMSSWFQYEALKYVSFPMQVMTKASKIIPVMAMSKIVSNKTYKLHEYILALFISIGLFLFIFATKDAVKGYSSTTTFAGVVLLLGYVIFDSFTSNWQSKLFKTHKMSSVQMMACVNLFSVIFTSVTLLEQGGFTEAASFMFRYEVFAFHVLLLGVCGAVGQLFIFKTIDEFGPVVFTLIMTIRLALSILLSSLFYGHPITPIGSLGIVIVFFSIFVNVYINQKKKIENKAESENITKT
ncbi:DgyrCDS7256 [Dimorphilus gyrociliatus]|uniref:Adenosine 3'-phospho 5'-phosphosulfate transporter 1 n=1 Tax=Dimorphilus gyrociliatus TaxID=2664684 RepID=A0A7I8VVG6_9ANNE|nr:DgyrCDS7256 [Dimorphilus gyrociliatus]